MLALGAAVATPATSGCLAEAIFGDDDESVGFGVYNGTDEPQEVTLHFRTHSGSESVEESTTLEPGDRLSVSLPIDQQVRVVATVSTDEVTAEESATVGGGNGRRFSANITEEGIQFNKDVI